jgi:NADPH-dependent glutamate synthase beta subunit-like oxidoreductase/ferredoxin
MKEMNKYEAQSKTGGETNMTDSGQLGFYVDQTRCTGCYTCAVACKDWHDIPAGSAKWLRISAIEKGTFPDLFLAFNVTICTHCIQAPCIAACPAGALSKREEDGIVIVDTEKCVGRDACGHPCSRECPAGNDVLGFVSLIREEKYTEACRLLVEHNPFPGVCGRVCSHPCESACTRDQVDEPLAIHALERFVADYIHTIPPCPIERKDHRVAVVGSGPAGLSCAYHLARDGYRVTVFEALPEPGGMLRVGIPDYRLPRAILDREIAFIESAGVEIKANMRLGDNLSIADLERFDAVFLAVGAHKEKGLDMPGMNLEGVMSGLEFLKEMKRSGEADIGKRVVVLGGGNVAFDCARIAHRLGAAEIHLVCPECYEDMPASRSEIDQGEEEGVVIHNAHVLSRILSRNNHVAGVECLGLRSMEFDAEGNLHFDALENSARIMQIDTVIVAIGQEPDLSFLPKGIRASRGTISTDQDGATSQPKYFAGGDAALSERNVSRAIGSGKRAAKAIDRMLRGFPKEKPAEDPATIQSKLLDTDFIEKKARVTIPLLPLDNRHQGLDEVERALDSEQARAEAHRCLICQGMCLVACPYDVPQFGAEDNPKMQKCDFCLEEWTRGKQPICVRACPTRALDAGPLDELRAKYGNGSEAEGFRYYENSEPAIIYKRKA